MINVNFKTHILRISLMLALLVSAFTCVYAVKNYQSNNVGQNIQFSIEGNKLGNMNPTKNSTSPQEVDKNSNFNDKAGQVDVNMKPPSEEGQSSDNQSQQIPQQGKNFQGSKGENKNRKPGQFGGNMQGGSKNSKYLLALSIYSGIFLILSFGTYYLFRAKKLQINLKDEKLLIFTLLGIGFLLRIAASTLMDGYGGDINLFKNWAEAAANGFSNFYASARQADYPPLYIYVLGLIGKIASIFNITSYYVLMLKIPSIIADIITSYFIYKLGKKHFSSIISISLAAFYIFNPAIFIDSTFWGQVDSIFALIVFSAIYLLSEKKYVFSSVIFAAAILMKPQGIIFLPILFFELLREKKIKNFIYAGISALITVLVIIIPFSLNQQSPLWIINLYTKTISEYPYASVNAFNFFSLIGANYKSYSTKLFIVDYHTLGMIFIAATTLIGCYIYIKGKDSKYVSAIALFQITGVFTFSVGMHERYLFPAVALAVLAFICLQDIRIFLVAIGLSITSYINISTILFNLNTSIFNTSLKVTSVLNILLAAYLLKVLLDNVVKTFALRIKKEESTVL